MYKNKKVLTFYLFYYSGKARLCCSKKQPLVASYSISFLFLKIHLFIWLPQVLFVILTICSCNTQTLYRGMWDLVPWPGIEPQSPALGVQNPSHLTPGKSPTFSSLCSVSLQGRVCSASHPGTLLTQLPSWSSSHSHRAGEANVTSHGAVLACSGMTHITFNPILWPRWVTSAKLCADGRKWSYYMKAQLPLQVEK